VIGGQTFLATPLSYGRAEGVNYKDISPRGGVAWDVFGNGKTAVKFNTGKYEDPASNLNNNYSISNPLARISTSTTRNFVANPANSVGTLLTVPLGADKIPACDFTNNAANGSCLGVTQNAFGTATPITAGIDSALLNGWGIRPNDWQIGASVQQQVLPKISVEFGYFWRWLGNFTATDNTAITAADFTPFSINAPLDPRLPGGGGYAIAGLANQANKFGTITNNITDAANFGAQYQRYHGILLNFSARASKGLTFQGGINSGTTVTDNCAVRALIPEAGLGIASSTAQNTYCHNEPGYITKASAVASYIIPRIDVLIAGTVRSDQGGVLAANWNANSVQFIQPALGRPVTQGAATTPINLVAPGQVWGDRVNELDFRFGKILRFGRMRINAGIDIFNVLNQGAILTYNQSFILPTATTAGSWLAPSSVLTPRFVKLGVQIDF